MFILRLIVAVIAGMALGFYFTEQFTRVLLKILNDSGIGSDLGGDMWYLGFGPMIFFGLYPLCFACMSLIPRIVLGLKGSFVRMIAMSYFGVIAILITLFVSRITITSDLAYGIWALVHGLAVVCYYEAWSSKLSILGSRIS